MIEDEDFRRELLKQNTEHRHELYKQNNQAAIDFSMKALWALFLLNGATGTAILAMKEPKPFFCIAFTFGIGAVFAVLAAMASYLLTLLIAETWRQSKPENCNENEKYIHIYIPWWKKSRWSEREIETFRWIVVGFAVLSLSCFVIGIFKLVRI